MRKNFLVILFFPLALLFAQQNALLIALPFAVEERIPRRAVAVLQLSDKAGLELLTVEIRRGALELFGPARSSLLLCPIEIGNGAHQLLVRVVADKTELVLDGELLGRAPPVSLPARPRVIFRPASRILPRQRPRLQKLAAINFRDDFAREGVSDTQWEVLSGTFALNMNRNPGSSQGAFQLWGTCPNGAAVAVAERSYWFWQDYRYGASLLPDSHTTAWGVIFCYLSQQDYHLFRVVRDDDGQRAEFLRRRQGTETILASQKLPAALPSWTRIEVFCRDGRLRGFVGGREVLQCRDRAAVGGRVGLYARQAQQLFVDDVTAVSLSQEESQATDFSEPFGPCEQLWSDFSDKHFSTDRHMTMWAHPRSFWTDDGQGIFWFRNRFFNDVEFQWQGNFRSAWRKNWRICLFSEGADPKSGYCFSLLDNDIVLFRQGQEVARVAQPSETSDNATLRASAKNNLVSLYWNDAQLLVWQDSQFLDKGEVGVSFSRPLPRYLDQARVLSSHRLDYSFEHAPAAWAIQAGVWQGVHRWACVPKWSFFGGRGLAGPQEINHGNAVLWNLRRIKGDFDLEIFAAPLEGTPQRAHFSWPVTLNVAFAADGQSLSSGYNLLFGTYDVASRLFWQGKEIASTDLGVEEDLRHQTTAWYHRMTQAWQHLRIQRRVGRILVDAAWHDDQARYLGLRRLFDLPAEDLDAAGQFAVWTYGDNGLSIARATLAFADSGGAASAPLQPPAVTACESDGIQAPEQYFRVENGLSGGLFARQLSREPVDLSVTPALHLSWRASADTHLSLFALIRGQCAEIILTGPLVRRPYSIFLAQADERPADWPGWQLLSVDLAAALRAYFPSGDLQVESLWLGSPYQTYAEIAGFSGNPYGAWYEYQAPQWQAAPQTTPPPPARGLILHCHGRRFYDDFEGDFGDWQRLGGLDGAALLLDKPEKPFSGRCLRLLNQRIGGAAGAWITRQKFSLGDFPALSFHYLLPRGIELNLLLIANGHWREILLNGQDASWPLLRPAAEFHSDGQWHRLEINLAERLAASMPGEVEIDGLALVDTGILGSLQRTAWWLDEFQLIPALAPGEVITVSDSTQQPVLALQAAWNDSPKTDCLDAPVQSGNVLSVPENAQGGWLHLQAQFSDGNWSSPRAIRYLPRTQPSGSSKPAAAVPPPLPPLLPPQVTYLPSDRLLLTDFEAVDPDREELTRFGEFTTRREAWVLLHEGSAAGGNACAAIVNLSERGFYSAYLRKSAWDVERWPGVSFDYRFAQPGCALNISLLVNDAMSIVEWTGENRPGNHFADAVVGKTEQALQDGQWHNTSFNLAEMLRRTRFAQADALALMTASELSFWATNHSGGGYVNPPEARLYIDNFMLYSERGQAPAFRWQQPQSSRPAVGYAYIFDQKADTSPPESINLQHQEITFAQVTPGEWYFHIRAMADKQQWSQTAHRKIIIRE